jgi:polyphosphate:AMP phosphotransferase
MPGNAKARNFAAMTWIKARAARPARLRCLNGRGYVMFEAAELGRKVTNEEFNAVAPKLREEMVTLQHELKDMDFPVVVLFGGVDGAGKSELINLLNEWMDPRWILTRAYDKPSDEEAERPEFWRYWRDLPASGQFGLFQSAWYTQPLLDRVYKRIGKAKFDDRLAHIRRFERTLADEGALILKFWMHLDKKAQKQRLKKLEKNPLHHWKITKKDWDHYKRYDRFIEAAEQLIARTSTAQAPWSVVEGRDSRYRALTVLGAIRDAVHAHREKRKEQAAQRAAALRREKRRKPRTAKAGEETILSAVDLPGAVAPEDYPKRLKALRARLHGLHEEAKAKGVSTVLVFEGWDAAGKGGTIRRLTSALDARDVRVHPIAAPSDEERAHHYLWRFWRRIERAGRVTIFDRSWYGRVLVERVEHFATQEEWKRAYEEINEFESLLAAHGMVTAKFWLHVDKDEQERRFLARKETPYKAWKLTDEDWRNREKWDAYEAAVNEMIERTSTRAAPWVVVEANDKKFARLKVIETVCGLLEERLG